MKYIVVLGDGMADELIEGLGGKTPLEYADTKAMDELAGMGEIGLARTIPEGMKPGSDTANLAVLGYDPKEYYTGRSPLEALSIGVPLTETDVAIRCNFVTLSDDFLPYEEKKILDHSAGEISTEDAAILLEAVRKELADDIFSYYVGTSYRHLLVWNGGIVCELTPPHDILTRKIGEYLPKEKKLADMMRRSYEILNHHPLNEKRAAAGLNKANSIWFWGAGTKPNLTSFEEKNRVRGVMVSAVDLLKGIAVGAGMKVIKVEGADGSLHTNYRGKAMAAADALLKDGYDFAYIHVEAPDEMGHQGSVEKKIQAIESIDSEIVAVIKQQLEEANVDYRMLIMPDHPTPVRLRTHTAEPVPYLLYDSRQERKMIQRYNEREAELSGNMSEKGWKLIDRLFKK
ncbi:MAG: cofactor-independent phosphoglycerate mutase [Lachnospiraceae bacterium]|nr:cofactor-independent phosphoglycerate mutase [Lachnospiraceae bacterium]